ncbi:unnamed protein product [Ostreobium quekettii]|uniref:SAC3/GANP/THP3 conserved domain-containing protein n=1 Tax=Ostreobium quekettii TaxID=121088 RepID=A0A8S1J106_9CHLO|nr:unnamed protein product [Ostreobium quekettii]
MPTATAFYCGGAGAANQAAPVPQVSQTRTDGSGWQTTQSTGMTGTVQPFFIKPNVPKQRARSPMRRAVKTQPADQSPQYTKVPDAAKPSAEPFPGSLKCFAERFFNRYPEKHYPNAPHKLEVLIHDARAKGELWSRNWDAFPLPELDQQPPPAADSVAQNLSSRRERRPNRWSAWTENNETARESHTSTSQRAHSKQGGVNASDRGWAGVEADVSLRDGERVGKSHIIRKARQAFKEDDLDAMQESVSLSNWDNQWEGGRRRGKRGAKRGARAVEHDDDSQPSNDTGYEYKRKGPGSAKRQKVNSKSFPDAEAVKRHRREERFQDTLGDNVLEVKPAKKQNFIHPLSDAREEDFCDVVIKGVSRQLEKSYLRLTSAPDPETVRPEPVLELALARLIKLLGNREVTYLYAGDQLKAIRQDCTVQRIRNHLAVRAYEAAARAALEYGDIAEFNQCQSVLQGLYDEGVEGCVPEFLAYRILYQAVHSALGESRGLRNTLQHMTEQEANDIVVGHALKVMEALQLDDFWSFFELYTKAPNLGRALMDHVLRFKRFGFIKMLAAAFRPSVSVGFLAEALCFYSAAAPGSSSEDGKIPPGCSLVYFPGKAGTKTDVEEGSALCIEWLEKHGAVLEQKTGSARASEVVVNTKLSLSKLYLPEDEEAVAHGDANLGLSDFLAKPTLMA